VEKVCGHQRVIWDGTLLKCIKTTFRLQWVTLTCAALAVGCHVTSTLAFHEHHWHLLAVAAGTSAVCDRLGRVRHALEAVWCEVRQHLCLCSFLASVGRFYANKARTVNILMIHQVLHCLRIYFVQTIVLYCPQILETK
jgi:hypothetical protein